MNNEKLLQKIQNIEKDALYEFKKMCDFHGISFYMRGGSVMGCVKYGGFVPWDDDIDIAVPREDYERMLNIFKDKIIANKYRMISYRYCDKLQSYIPRIFLLEEVRKKERLPINNKLGLCLIDLFPIDSAPHNAIARYFYIMKTYFYRLLASLDTVYDNQQIDMHSNIHKRMLSILKKTKINKLYLQKNIYLHLEKVYQKNNLKNNNYLGTITASLMKKELMHKDIWGNGVIKKFEGIDVKIPEQYDIYLKKLYGKNYMNEEPLEKKSHINRK